MNASLIFKWNQKWLFSIVEFGLDPDSSLDKNIITAKNLEKCRAKMSKSNFQSDQIA